MVELMSMFETVVQVALVTSHTDHFLLLTAALGAFICKDLWGEKQLSLYSFYRDIIFSLLPFWGRPTFRFLWAGSDLQSLSICSPTVMSGISPLLMGMGVLHNGHTGTWISCTRKQMCQPQPVCFKHWLKYTTGQDYYSLDNHTHLLIWWSALVICISYVVFAENFFTGITFHWKKICIKTVKNKQSYNAESLWGQKL